jgi:hypothetical protein
MSDQYKVRGIVEIFENIKDELGMDQGSEYECKCKVAHVMDQLFGPCWRSEVAIGVPFGADPFGGGWMPDIDLQYSPSPIDIDRMYNALRKYAKDREIPRDNLEHMPSEMKHEVYDKIKPTTIIKAVIKT